MHFTTLWKKTLKHGHTENTFTNWQSSNPGNLNI